MWSFEVSGLPDSLPRRWANSFCSSLSKSFCLRKKTTPRCETVLIRIERVGLTGCHTCDCEIAQQFVRVRCPKPLLEIYIGELAADDWSYIKGLVLIEGAAQLEWSSMRCGCGLV
jgi:hypothetical protein